MYVQQHDPRGVSVKLRRADWRDKSGGTIIVRKGPNVVTVTGTISKAAAIGMAKLAVSRVGAS
ncbi:MAG TPA: hypothetical protein VFM14_18010 [Gemmatimonadales bacterium]|nr:hypothetical protein [Gemmatimonadales bacterium]